MRRLWAKVGGLGVALVLFAGCQNSKPELKPNDLPENWNLPPKEDARFSGPVSYPKETLNTDLLKKDPNQAGNGNKTPPGRFGPGGGMGGY